MTEMRFFDLNIKILKLSGLWVPNPNNNWKYRRAIAYNSICVLYSMIYFTIAELISLKESAANLNDLVKNLNMLMSFLLTLIKVIVWFRYRKDILKIIRFLEIRRNVFKDHNFNNDEIILRELQFKDAWTKSFLLMSTLVPLSAGILSLTETLTTGEKYVVFRNDSSLIYIQKLPYYSWIPFDHSSSKCAFRIAVVSQCIALLNCGYITVGLDMLFVALASSITAHFMMIKEAFRRIGNFGSNEFDNAQKLIINDNYIKFKNCMMHLQTLIKICQRLEVIYSFLVLMQVLVSLVVLCTCLYLVSSIPVGVRLLGNELAYLLAIEIQVAVYCFVGNKLTDAKPGRGSRGITGSRGIMNPLSFSLYRVLTCINTSAYLLLCGEHLWTLMAYARIASLLRNFRKRVSVHPDLNLPNLRNLITRSALYNCELNWL